MHQQRRLIDPSVQICDHRSENPVFSPSKRERDQKRRGKEKKKQGGAWVLKRRWRDTMKSGWVGKRFVRVKLGCLQASNTVSDFHRRSPHPHYSTPYHHHRPLCSLFPLITSHPLLPPILHAAASLGSHMEARPTRALLFRPS